MNPAPFLTRCLAWFGCGLSLIAGDVPVASQSGEAADRGPVLRSVPFQIGEADRTWWAFQPVRRPVLPPGDAGRHPIDALLRQQLASKGLTPSPPANRRELLRRVTFDLLGLPPSPEAVAAFEADRSPDAWGRVIDGLLARPEYGERWARHWLDLVRFAESNGYERDGVKPEAWRYRDYVVRAFNEDRGYDRFLTEQLAGDEAESGYSAEGLIATGFYRLHVWDDEPDSTLAAEFDDLDDILVTTTGAFMGLTVGCARCHDHKFDPISQAEYYQLLAHFRSLNPYGQHHTGGGGRGTGRILRPLASPEELRQWESDRAVRLAAARAGVQAVPAGGDRKAAEAKVRQIEGERPPFPQALAISEDPLKPTFILRRGDVLTPGAEVQPGVPAVLGLAAPIIRQPPAGSGSSGRRLALARWLTQPGHPLTGRVLVNRIWQHHFGVGLVPTPNDFGRTGLKPTHPAILDWLAAELVAGDWRIKRMHRLILTSEAYQMSSRSQRPEALARDEGNSQLWRQNPRRLEAEVIRDTLLALTGNLDPRAGGPSFFPTLPPEVHRTQDAAGKGWGESPAAEQDRRSLYVFVKRALPLPLLDAFDAPTTTVPVGMRSVTTVAPQALMLLNDRWVRSQAARLADRLQGEAGDAPEPRVRRAFRLVLQRDPNPTELAASLGMLAAQRTLAGSASPPDADRQAWVNFCGALFNLNELLHVD
jgi:hypothetical protein